MFTGLTNANTLDKATAIIVFFNKIDVLREKFASGTASFNSFFPDYRGSNNDFRGALAYVEQRFRNVVREPGRKVHFYYTDATDADSIRQAMDSVQEDVFSLVRPLEREDITSMAQLQKRLRMRWLSLRSRPR
jgi:G-protein alpha subunit